jgi:hypothetical protein
MANLANPQINLFAPALRCLNVTDALLARRYIGSWRDPDLTIAPDGQPYLYRWHLAERNREANIYFHVQVASDPERPLHDHPWDNTSVILSGSYREVLDNNPADEFPAEVYTRRVGDVIYRKAETAHRLFLPEGVPYTMTLFTTGPHKRDWGFWFADKWRSNREVVFDKDGMSQFLEPSI